MGQMKPEDFARVMGVMDTDKYRAQFETQVQSIMAGAVPSIQDHMLQASPSTIWVKNRPHASLEAFVATAIGPHVTDLVRGMVRGRPLRGLDSLVFNVAAKATIEFDAWNDKASVVFAATLQTPNQPASPLPTSTTRVSFGGVNAGLGILGRDDPAALECLRRVARDLAAPHAVWIQLPESARKIVDTLAAPITLDGVSGYRTKIESGMEWLEPAEVFPSDALLGRIIALA